MKAKMWIGRLVLFSTLTMFSTGGAMGEITYRLRAATESDLVFRTPAPDSLVGLNIAPAGDVNGDGLADVVAGAPGINQAFIILGRKQRSGVFTLNPTATGLIIIRADIPGDEFGWSVSRAGDFNGDLVDDVIIGWPRGDGLKPEAGAAVVVFGDPGWTQDSPAIVLDLSLLIGSQGFLLQGMNTGDRAGSAVAGGGDTNGDGLSDVVVAAPGARAGSTRGVFYVIYGLVDPPATLPVGSLAGLGFEIHTSVMGGIPLYTSSTVCAWPGDVNGDNVDDLLLGTPLYEIAGYKEVGAAWLIPGMLGTPPPVFSLDNVGSTVPGTRITLDPTFGDHTHAGFSVSGIGDLNNDGKADIAIGVPDEKWLGTGGMVGIVLGDQVLPPMIDLYGDPRTFRIVDDLSRDGDRFGASVAAAGDPNNDGVPDLVIGAPQTQLPSSLPWPAGFAYVIYGREAPEDVFLSGAYREAVEIFGVFGSRPGDGPGDLFGWSVCGPGDLNGDGVDDVSVGAPFVRPLFLAQQTLGMVFNFFFEPPHLLAVFHDDVSNTMFAEPGEMLHLVMSLPVHVEPGPADDLFFIANTGQLDPASDVFQKRPDSRRFEIELGPATSDIVVPGMQSAIDFNPFGEKNRVVSRRLGVNPVDTGAIGANDTGVDIRKRLRPTSGTIRALVGGAIASALSPDALYVGHKIEFAPNALGADAQVGLRPIPDPPGDMGFGAAVQVWATEPFSEALLTIKFRDEDVPPRMTKRQMRVARIVEDAPGLYSLQIVPGPQTVDVQNNTVSVEIGSLQATSGRQRAQGGSGSFAGVPIETVDENRASMSPFGENEPKILAKTGLAYSRGKMATVTLTPGPLSIYTKHKLVFHDYVTSTPGAVVVTIRTATLAERTYTHPVVGSQYFPDKSDAVFTIETEDASQSPVAVTSPVDITIEYKPSNNPKGYSDIMDFNENPAYWKQMRIVRSVQNPTTYVPNFVFIGGAQQVDYVESVVEITNFTNLTDSQGKATYGVVADPSITSSAHWPLYR